MTGVKASKVADNGSNGAVEAESVGETKDIFPRNFHKHVEHCQNIADNPEAYDITFLPREFIQTTLPYRQPKGNPITWYRKNGDLTLYIRPGVDHEKQIQLPYPSGNIPRLILCWIATEVMRTDKPRIEFSHTFAEFMRMLNLNPRGGGKRSDFRRLKDQMSYLFQSTIGFDYRNEKQQSWLNMSIAPKGQIWWSELYPNQPDLFDNWIELSPDFFQAIRKQAVPLDLRILTAPKIKERPMAIDLYAWSTRKIFLEIADKEYPKDIKVPWSAFKNQMGTDYTRLRDFKAQVLKNFSLIQIVYEGLKLDFPDKDYFVIKRTSKPSVPAISKSSQALK